MKHLKIFENFDSKYELVGDHINDVLLKYIDSENILIVAHQAVCRILFSYFYNIPIRDCDNMKINNNI